MKERMITRTVEMTVCEVLCMDLTAETSMKKTFEVPAGVTTEKHLLKSIKSQCGETIVPVSILSREKKVTLYGMTERKFIENAEILPPRGSKEETNADPE